MVGFFLFCNIEFRILIITMDIVIISVTALFVAGLTFFSGFGLGTLLMPVFAVFFPLEIAIAATAIVHLANNIFKLLLVGKLADKKIVMQFGIPAAAAAFLGAYLLNIFSDLQPVFSYSLFGKDFGILPIKLVIGILIITFSLMEISPVLNKIKLNKNLIPLGGTLSGFFGGLSGHQGALRTAFLVKAGLDKSAFIGTMVVCGVIVDLVRISVYGTSFLFQEFTSIKESGIFLPLIFGSLFAFIGSYFGKYFFEKVTFKSIQVVISVLLLIFGVALGAGII